MFHHEKLRVYQRALEFAAWSQILVDGLAKKTSTRDQLERAGDSIAHGSTLESAACLDLLVARRCCESETVREGKQLLEEIVKMLFAMLDRLGCRIVEEAPVYGERAAEEGEED